MRLPGSTRHSAAAGFELATTIFDCKVLQIRNKDKDTTRSYELELELIQAQALMAQKPELRVEVAPKWARVRCAIGREEGGGCGGERVQRPVGLLAQMSALGPQNRKRPQKEQIMQLPS